MMFSLARKWTITMLLCLMCLIIGLSTAAYSAGLSEMTQEVGTDKEVGQVGLFVFNFSFAVVPLFLSPLVSLNVLFHMSLVGKADPFSSVRELKVETQSTSSLSHLS